MEEIIAVRPKGRDFICGADGLPYEFANVNKAMEFLQVYHNRPNLYDDYEYELLPKRLTTSSGDAGIKLEEGNLF